MNKETDEFEENEEELEKEEKIINEETETGDEQTPTERYTAIYQEPIIGILDTVTKEMVMQRTLKLDASHEVDEATFRAMALNKLEKIGVASGA